MGKIEFYNKNGFFIEKGLIALEDIERVNTKINNLILSQLREININYSDDLIDNLKILFKNDLDRYLKTIGSIWRMIDVANLMHDKNIIEFVKDVFDFGDIVLPGGQVVHVQSSSLRVPGGYFGFEPHQDYQSVQGSLDGLIIWIPLTNIDEENYPLEVIPGSHLDGLHPIISSKNEPARLDPSSYDKNDFKSIVVEKGDVVFMSYFTIHRSGKKGLPNNVRIAVSTRFDNSNEITYIKRAFFSAYQRTVKRDLSDKSFPSTNEILSVFKNKWIRNKSK